MDFVFAALVGWCGTHWWRWRWPYPWPWPRPRPWPGPEPGPDPDPFEGPITPDPNWREPQLKPNGGPPWLLRDFRDGLIGAVTGAITFAVLGNHFAASGMIGIALLGFVGGKVGAEIIGGVIDIATSK